MFARRLCVFPANSRHFHDLRPYSEDTRWPGWQVVIGIETHAQIRSRRKLFSYSQTSTLDASQNIHVSPFDAAFPGTLPKINPKCVDLAIRTALALKCHISSRSSFDRKHYFYSDLPSGFQITQHYSPLASNGELNLLVLNSLPVKIRIKQIQLEQDTAKSTYNPRTLTSNIDLNRAGIGLMEIVTEPDLRSPEEAGAYVRFLQSLLRALGSSDGNMEKGSLRCDINISVNRKDDVPGTRCEIKNLNSVKFMMAAIKHEIHRQSAFLLANPGVSLPQETRGFDENTFETYLLRSKEEAPDYRYMPDPNLGVLVLSQARIQEIHHNLPLLPQETRSRLLDKFPELQSKQQSLDTLVNVDNGREVPFDGESSGGAVNYFEQLCLGKKDKGQIGIRRNPGIVLNWLINELIGQLSVHNKTFDENPLTVDQFGELIDIVQNGYVTGTSGKYLLKHMLTNPTSHTPSQLAEELQLTALSSNTPDSSSQSASSSSSSSPKSELQILCEAAIQALPREVASFRAGNKNVLNRIIGYVMKQSRGRADAKVVRNLVEQIVLHEGR